MTKYAAPLEVLPDYGGAIVMTAPFTMGNFSHILDDRLSASIPCKHEINGCMLRHPPGGL